MELNTYSVWSVTVYHVDRMATSLSVKKCPICQDDIKDPRLLPCIHTFCLECLERYCKDKLPGDDAPCPECRQEFRIPKVGVAGLTVRTHDEELAQEFARHIDDEIKQVTSRIESFRGVAAHVEEESSKLLGSMQATEQEIKTKGEQVKQSFIRLIDCHVIDLLNSCLLYTSPSPRDS